MYIDVCILFEMLKLTFISNLNLQTLKQKRKKLIDVGIILSENNKSSYIMVIGGAETFVGLQGTRKRASLRQRHLSAPPEIAPWRIPRWWRRGSPILDDPPGNRPAMTTPSILTATSNFPPERHVDRAPLRCSNLTPSLSRASSLLPTQTRRERGRGEGASRSPVDIRMSLRLTRQVWIYRGSDMRAERIGRHSGLSETRIACKWMKRITRDRIVRIWRKTNSILSDKNPSRAS